MGLNIGSPLLVSAAANNKSIKVATYVAVVKANGNYINHLFLY